MNIFPPKKSKIKIFKTTIFFSFDGVANNDFMIKIANMEIANFILLLKHW